MGKWKRRKDLDKYDDQFGLLIAYATQNLQTGQIEYSWDNEIGANYEWIDKQKGRILSGWLDDLPVYVPIGDKEKQEASSQRVLQYEILKSRMNQILEEIREENKKLGYDQEHLGYLV